MKTAKDYDRQVCVAVRNAPLQFIDIMNEAAETAGMETEGILREAACIIANLYDRLGIPPWPTDPPQVDSPSLGPQNTEERMQNI